MRNGKWHKSVINFLSNISIPENVIGDLSEMHQYRMQTRGRKRAGLEFYKETIITVIRYTIKNIGMIKPQETGIMLHNNIRNAFRSLLRKRHYSFLNIASLTITLSVTSLLYLFIKQELAYEKIHTNSKRIVRIATERKYDDGTVQQFATSSFPLTKLLEAKTHSIEKSVRIFNPKWYSEKVPVKYEDKVFYEEGFFFADSTIMSVFSFSFLSGHAATSLQDPFSVIISDKIARKYFPEGEDPIGKSILYGGDVALQITGVFRAFTNESHLDFDFISTMDAFASRYGNYRLDLWGSEVVYSYLLLKNEDSQPDIAAAIAAFLPELNAEMYQSRGYKYELILQPIESIHLYSTLPWELLPNGSIRTVRVLGIVAILLLVVTCVNFSNLSSALILKRHLEVGLRKLFGANRMAIVVHFFAEYALPVAFALVLSSAIVGFVLKNSLDVFGLSLNPSTLEEITVSDLGMFILLGIVIVITTTSASLALLRLPLNQLLVKVTTARPASFLQQSLLIIQFSFSVFLGITGMVVINQIDYMLTSDLGFNRDHVVVLRENGLNENNVQIIKNELLKVNSVQSVSASSSSPGGKIDRMRIREKGGEQFFPVNMVWADEDYASTLGLNLISGTSILSSHEGDSVIQFLVNESAAKILGFSDPIGEQIEWISFNGLKRGPIVGVVKDYNYTSLKEHIEPVVILKNPSMYNTLLVKIEGSNYMSTLKAIEKIHSNLLEGQPVEFTFLEQKIANLYRDEKMLGRVINAFTVIAFAISCIGMYCLSAFMIEQKLKEIGIRKVLGANFRDLIIFLSKRFMILTLIALIIAIPIASYFSNDWLATFVHRTSISWVSYLVVAFITIVVTFLSILFECIKAAIVNPILLLRSE